MDADTMYDAFNRVFLTRSGDDVFYKAAINKTEKDGTVSKCPRFPASDLYGVVEHVAASTLYPKRKC